MELISGSYKALEREFLKYFATIKKNPLEKVLIITQSKRLAQSLKEKLLSSNEYLSCVFWQDMLGLVCAINQTSENYISLKQKTELDYFKLKNFLQNNKLNSSVGYGRALQTAFMDMQNALIMPQDLLKIEELDETLGTKDLKELIFIYENYLKLTEVAGKNSYKDFFTSAYNNIAQNKYLSQFKQIIFYGIYDFTALQYDILKEISQNYPTTIFFPYEDIPAYKYIKDFYLTNIVGLGLKHKKAALPKTELETFCSHLFEGPQEQETKYLAPIKIIDTSGTLDQVKSAAKEVLLLRKQGLAFKDIAVCARSLEPYKDYLAQVFEQNAIPININFEELFNTKPLINICLSLLNISRNNFNKDSVLSFINSPYLKNRQPFWPQTIKNIGVQTGFEQWVNLLDQAIAKGDNSALTLKILLTQIKQRVDKLEEATNFEILTLRARDIFNLFLDLDNLSEEEQKLFDRLERILKDISSFDKVRHAKKGEFLDEFTYLVEQEKVNIVVNLENSLTIADIMNLRGQSFKAIIILGLNEGQLPASVSEDPVFKDSWRSALQKIGYNIKVSAQRYLEEKLFFYFALSAAGDKAVLIYERCDSEGKLKIDSIYLSLLEKILDKPERFSLSRRPLEQLAQWYKISPDLLNPQEAAILSSIKGNFALAAQLVKKEQEPFAKAFSFSLEGPLGPHDLICSAKGPLWQHIRTKGISPSSFKNAYLCPARYLFENILKKEDSTVLQRDQLDHRDRGNLAHKILEQFYSHLSKNKLFDKIFAKGSLEILQDFIDQNLPQEDYKKYGLYPLLWFIYCKEMEQEIKDFVVKDLTRLQEEHKIPSYFEKNISADFDDLKIQGKIDRIDISEDKKSFEVMDYKTGNMKESALKLIFELGNLQGPFYFEMAKNLPELKNSTPDKMSYGRIKEQAFRDITYQEYLTFKDKFWSAIKFLKDLIEEGFFIINPGENNCAYCNYSDICRKNHGPSQRRAFFSTQAKKIAEFRKYDKTRAKRNK